VEKVSVLCVFASSAAAGPEIHSFAPGATFATGVLSTSFTVLASPLFEETCGFPKQFPIATKSKKKKEDQFVSEKRQKITMDPQIQENPDLSLHISQISTNSPSPLPFFIGIPTFCTH
jgi:hypothetical protein